MINYHKYIALGGGHATKLHAKPFIRYNGKKLYDEEEYYG